MRLFAAALLCTSLAASARAGALGETPVQMPSPYRPMSAAGNFTQFRPAVPTEDLRPLRHRWAFGFDYVPGLGGGGGALAQPNALSLRWWATDRLGVDVAGTLASQAVSGSAATTGTLNSYGGALGLRYVLSEPSKDLLVLAVMRGGYAQAAPDSPAQVATTAGFVGLGFEAFIPGWDWLSVEGSAGASYLAQQTAGGPSSSALAAGAGGTSPVDLSVHVYF